MRSGESKMVVHGSIDRTSQLLAVARGSTNTAYNVRPYNLVRSLSEVAEACEERSELAQAARRTQAQEDSCEAHGRAEEAARAGGIS